MPLSLIVVAILTAGAPAPSDLSFTRFDYQDFDRGGLSTATVTLRRNQTEVSLVSVLHIADKPYYEEIQRDLDSYDAVFYELVSDTAPESLSTLSALQIAAGEVLRLSFQLESLDYTRDNLVHADMSWPEIERLLGTKTVPIDDEAIGKILPNVLGKTEEAVRYFEANPEVRRSLKVFLGQLLGDVAALLDQLNVDRSGKGEDVLVSARNRRVMEVIAPHLEGKRRIAILYGAAHMPDFALRLRALGFRPVETRWHLAWRIGDIPEPRWF